MGRGRRRGPYRPGSAVRAIPGMAAVAVAAGAVAGGGLHLLPGILAVSARVTGVRLPAGYATAGILLVVLLVVLAAMLCRSPALPPPPPAARAPHDEVAALDAVIATLEADRAFWFAVAPPGVTPAGGARVSGRLRRTRSGHRVAPRPAPRCCWGRRAPLRCGGATR